MRRALFLDRDGVINADHGYISGSDRFDVIEGVFDALRRAQELGYLLVVVTNQSGIARGYFTDDDYRRIEHHMREVFLAEGITFDAIYHCPHHPDGIIPALAVRCDCRKPEPGMILRAARDHNIDLAASIMVGDKDSDIAAARAAGVGRAYLVDAPRFTLKDIKLG